MDEIVTSKIKENLELVIGGRVNNVCALSFSCQCPAFYKIANYRLCVTGYYNWNVFVTFSIFIILDVIILALYVVDSKCTFQIQFSKEEL